MEEINQVEIPIRNQNENVQNLQMDVGISMLIDGGNNVENTASHEINSITEARLDIEVNSSTTPARNKKRKRSTTNSTPKHDNNSDNDDDGLTCPICLESWEMSGEHRLSSLRCGHLFGYSCIRRWLDECNRQSGQKYCPQCKSKVTVKDVRFLYARRLRAIDRSEEINLREELEEERKRSSTMQVELSTLKITNFMVTKKVQALEAENVRLSNLLKSGAFSCDASADTKMSQLPFYKLFMEKNIDICREPGCRVMIHCQNQNSLIVSQKSMQSLFPGYGVRFIDTATFRLSQFIHLKAKNLRDMTLSADQQLLAVASMETHSKLFDLRMNQYISTFTPGDKGLWACAMDRETRENFLYLGAQHGSTYLYDTRFPDTVVDEFKTEGDLSPVINIAPVSANKNFGCGGFLVCKLQSLWFYEYESSSSTVTPTRLNIEGPFVSMNYDAAQGSLLISTRNSSRYSKCRFIFGYLEKVEGTPIFNIKIFFPISNSAPVMVRSSQVLVEENTLIAGYFQDSKMLALFDTRREKKLQAMPVQDLVYDTCPIYTSTSTYLAALTDTKCRIYKLTKIP